MSSTMPSNLSLDNVRLVELPLIKGQSLHGFLNQISITLPPDNAFLKFQIRREYLQHEVDS